MPNIPKYSTSLSGITVVQASLVLLFALGLLLHDSGTHVGIYTILKGCVINKLFQALNGWSMVLL